VIKPAAGRKGGVNPQQRPASRIFIPTLI